MTSSETFIEKSFIQIYGIYGNENVTFVKCKDVILKT